MSCSLDASTSGAGGLISTADNTGSLQLKTAGTTALTIDTSQNVGIGTASPAVPLDVVSLSTNGYGISLRGRSSDNASTLNLYNNAGTTRYGFVYADTGGPIFGSVGALPAMVYTNGTEKMRIDSSGNMFLGKTADSSSVQGLSFFPSGSTQSANNGSGTVIHYEFYRSGTRVGRIETTTSATSYVTSSDYRLKEEIAPMTGALDKVAQLKPVTYKWKVDGSNGQGFIAHELQEVIPDCVSGQKDAVNEDGSIDPQGIDTSFLVATLTAAIQEQQTIINDLKARVTALEAK
jgi:hypothetical protein